MQPYALVTLTVSVTVPAAPAVKVTRGVPWPAVIVPPVIDHENAMPVHAASTDAMELAPE